MSAAATMLATATSFPTSSLSASSVPSSTYTSDPILEHRPSFALSMPVQVLFIGVVLTLMVVLLGHLLFTAQYHWPLAPTNFVLQVAGVVTLLVSQIATLHVVFNSTKNRSDYWPYMFEYVAIDIPPFSWEGTSQYWKTDQIIAWQIMNATTAGIIQITHIQFLTLLYPSRLERYLILAILGPLALASASMELIPVNWSTKITEIADVVNNVCDATLSLLFTAALLLWGVVVNRHEAWRLDGGTAAFGAGACILAFISTALTFVYIPKRDQYGWMPNLILAVILWQSFLGWWWWVGAAGAGASGDELVRKEEKRRKKRETRANRRQQRSDAAREWWRGFTSTFGGTSVPPAADPHANQLHSEDEMVSVTNASGRSDELSSPATIRPRRPWMPDDSASQSTGSKSSFYAGQPAYLRFFHTLRQAHRHAARQQAFEHNSRIAQAYGSAAAEGEAPIGWGLGSYGARELTARREEENASTTGRQSGDYTPIDGGDRDVNVGQQRPTPSGALWWGPLKRWRLQDSTSYR